MSRLRQRSSSVLHVTPARADSDSRDATRRASRNLAPSTRRATRSVAATAFGLLVLISTPIAHAVQPSDYTLARTFTLPTANNAMTNTVLVDTLADGRLLAVNETQVLRETAVGSGAFVSLGTIPNFSPTFGPSFLAVSPDGSRAAVGSNFGGSITVFNTAAPTTATNYAINDTDAAWIDNNRLAVSNGSGVQVLTLTTSNVTTVIANVGGASAGVAFDAAGNLYTGNGFDGPDGGTDTGYVKAFAKTAWETAAAGGTPLNFETGGSAIADLLSAGSIGFDTSGNLFVGGADFYDGGVDVGYAALVAAAAVQAAFAAGSSLPPIDANSPAAVLRKVASPADTVANFQAPIWAYNDFTGELYLRYFGSGQVSVFVPEPSALAGLLLGGLAVLRRRRGAVAGVAIAAAASSASAAYVFDKNDFAVEVVSSTGLSGAGLYDAPSAVLGRPTLMFKSGTDANPDIRRAKLIEAVFNVGPANERLLTTFNAGQSVTVMMGRAVTDDPGHPFGIDFNVFGNAFFSPVGGGTTSDATNLNVATVGTGAVFSENVRVSVSPDNVQWYSYGKKTGDSLFPTNGYRWDRAAAAWSDDALDPRLPVNPALIGTLAGKTGADVLDLYNGSAGGVGFDLADSGFTSIRYVRFEGVSDFFGGEIDAVAVVPEPALLGLAGVATVALRRRARRTRPAAD